MKLKRTDLITRVEEEIRRRIDASEERHARAMQRYEQRCDEYFARTAGAWEAFAATIQTAMDAGRPIVADDIPVQLRAGYIDRGHVAVWDDRLPEQTAPDIQHLQMLLSLLEAATDDEVTLAGLERAGFRTRNLFR